MFHLLINAGLLFLLSHGQEETGLKNFPGRPCYSTITSGRFISYSNLPFHAFLIHAGLPIFFNAHPMVRRLLGGRSSSSATMG
jgi:hypothetical protein